MNKKNCQECGKEFSPYLMKVQTHPRAPFTLHTFINEIRCSECTISNKPSEKQTELSPAINLIIKTLSADKSVENALKYLININFHWEAYKLVYERVMKMRETDAAFAEGERVNEED